MKKSFLIVLLIIPLIAACSTIVLQPVNFGWAIENVLTSDANGMVEEQRHAISFNITPLFQAEFGDSVKADSKEIRIICSTDGFYFVTSKTFKNVYVLAPAENSLKVDNKILINEQGLLSPVFNQRDTHIELIDGANIYKLTSKGITVK
ncbi:MAG: hypothetical protein A2068_07915 [Ignavibacteria bacterium GWB2_35_6b]|nr:MAG: hypothetical protein A2068_07915 [Ignavibacteria bacterium GWB2_35_6b]